MGLALLAVHVRLTDVADVVEEKAEPESRMPGKAIELPPTQRDGEGMKPKRVCPEEHGFSANFHRKDRSRTCSSVTVPQNGHVGFRGICRQNRNQHSTQ